MQNFAAERADTCWGRQRQNEEAFNKLSAVNHCVRQSEYHSGGQGVVAVAAAAAAAAATAAAATVKVTLGGISAKPVPPPLRGGC
jgi:hypothetical protein